MAHAPKGETLAERLARLGIREDDLDESFVRSGGKGGQNVNKVSTCVVLLHRPTGLQVKCQEDRSQSLNRERARELLAEKLEMRLETEKRTALARAAKLRRQKRRRSAGSKERMLADKRARATTKVRRGRVRSSDGD